MVVEIRRVLRDNGWAGGPIPVPGSRSNSIELWMENNTRGDETRCTQLRESARGEGPTCVTSNFIAVNLHYNRWASNWVMAVACAVLIAAGRLGAARVVVPEPRCVLLVPGGVVLLTLGSCKQRRPEISLVTAAAAQ